MKRRIAQVVPLAALIAALALVPGALAGKGGHTTATAATLSSDCSPCAVGTLAHFTGSGLDGSQPTAVVSFKSAEATVSGMVSVNADGTYSFSWDMNPAGTYNVTVSQVGVGNKLVVDAETTITVQ